MDEDDTRPRAPVRGREVEIRDLVRVVAVADDGAGGGLIPCDRSVARPAASREQVAAGCESVDDPVDVVDGVVEVRGDAEVVVAVRADDPLLQELAAEASDVGRADADERAAPGRVAPE